MKTYLAAAALLLAFAFSLVSLDRGAVAQTSGVCPTNPSPPDAADPSMIVNEPADGARVTSPVTISGEARVFEANVRITIFDADGNELVDTFTTAAEAGPVLAPYSEDVAFTTPAEQAGCIRVFEESADDGSPVNVVQVEVTLAPVTTPPATGTAGLQGEGASSNHMVLYVAGALALLAGAVLALERRLWQ